MPEARLVFLAPPSWEELKRRLIGRGTDDEETIRHRLEHAHEELAAEPEFDVTVVNHFVEQAADDLVGLLDLQTTPVSHVSLNSVENTEGCSVSGTIADPEGITNPPIDELLEKTSSKYALVIFAAKRARQINAYYSQLGEGLLEYVGPAGRDHPAGEAAVDRAARDQRQPPHRRADRGLSAGRRPGPTRRPGSCSASAAGSPRTRPASCCGCSPSRATPSGSCRPPPRCGSSASRPGRPCPASRSPPTSGTTSTRCRTSRIGQHGRPGRGGAGHRRPAGQGRPRPRRRPADQHAAHRALPGGARPGHAHRDVGAPGHRGQRRHPARARRHRHRAGDRPAHRRRHRQGPAARPDGDLRGRPPRAAAPRRGPRRWPAATSSSPPAAPASRSTRCGSWATAPRASRGTRFARTAVARGARVTLIAANVALPDPAGVDLVRVGTTEELRKATLAAAAERRRGGDGRRAGRLPAGRVRRHEDQEGRRSGTAPTLRAGGQPRHRRRAGRAQAPGPGAGRVRRRDVTTRSSNARAKLVRKRADLIVVNEVGVGQGLRPGDQRGHRARRRRIGDRDRPRRPRRTSPTSSGTWWRPARVVRLATASVRI